MRKIIVLTLISIALSGCGSFWELVMTDDERQLLRKTAKDAAACQVTKVLQVPMWHKDLYMWQQGSCVVAPLRDENWFGEDEKAPQKRFFSDLFCREPVQFQLTRYHSFCNDYAITTRLGSDQNLEKANAWTLNPASRFRVPLLKQYGFNQPFMTTRVYSRVNVSEEKKLSSSNGKETLTLRRGNGVCELQMRIYKPRIDKQGYKPLLAFHGGGWHQGLFYVLALDRRVPEFTD